jgi:hypothetical protein
MLCQHIDQRAVGDLPSDGEIRNANNTNAMFRQVDQSADRGCSAGYRQVHAEASRQFVERPRLDPAGRWILVTQTGVPTITSAIDRRPEMISTFSS